MVGAKPGEIVAASAMVDGPRVRSPRFLCVENFEGLVFFEVNRLSLALGEVPSAGGVVVLARSLERIALVFDDAAESSALFLVVERAITDSAFSDSHLNDRGVDHLVGSAGTNLREGSASIGTVGDCVLVRVGDVSHEEAELAAGFRTRPERVDFFPPVQAVSIRAIIRRSNATVFVGLRFKVELIPAWILFIGAEVPIVTNGPSPTVNATAVSTQRVHIILALLSFAQSTDRLGCKDLGQRECERSEIGRAHV